MTDKPATQTPVATSENELHPSEIQRGQWVTINGYTGTWLALGDYCFYNRITGFLYTEVSGCTPASRPSWANDTMPGFAYWIEATAEYPDRMPDKHTFALVPAPIGMHEWVQYDDDPKPRFTISETDDAAEISYVTKIHDKYWVGSKKVAGMTRCEPPAEEEQQPYLKIAGLAA